ncbi:MAG: DUF3726 domain-containing protein [Pseudomonadales bacterium]
MQVSMNELKAALRRCFEATGYFIGNYEDAADMIVWLEKHGLNGLAEFERTLPFIDCDQAKELSTVTYEDNSSAIIDSHNRSSLNCIATAVDLAYAKALRCGVASVTVHNCHNRMFVLKALTDCGRRGVSAVAYWRNGSGEVREHTAAIGAGQRYPDYQAAATHLDAAEESHQTLEIICSARVDLHSSLQHSDQLGELEHISAQQIARNKARNVKQGICISESLWHRINQIGEGVLVESSEQSRQGAGA